MKYSHSSRHSTKCPHDPQTRAQLGYRLRVARLRLGWSPATAAKNLQVSERTLHNWETGRHRIPWAVYKLLRILSRYELPGGWSGYRIEGDDLITPEGRSISCHDASWWSLLVRRAHGFDAQYARCGELERAMRAVADASASDAGRRAVAASVGGVLGSSGLDRGAVSREPGWTTPPSNTGVNAGKWGQGGAIMGPWHSTSDSPPPSISRPAPTANGSESASIRSLGSPSMPTCGLLSPPEAHLSSPNLSRPHHSLRSPPPSAWLTCAWRGPLRLSPSPSIPAPRPDLLSSTRTTPALPSGGRPTPRADATGGRS